MTHHEVTNMSYYGGRSFIHRLLLGASLTFPFLAIPSGLAFVSGLPLPSMVEKADLIVVGEVVRIEKAKPMPSGVQRHGYNAVVELEETLKGDSGRKTIEVYYTRIPDDAHFNIGERDVIFLKIQEEILLVLDGLNGKLEIKNEMVRPIFMKDEPKKQPLKNFIGKIKTLLQKDK